MVLFYKWLLKSIFSMNILLDVPLTRDVRFSNSPPRDDNTTFLSILNRISTENQQHTQLKVMCYILDSFDFWNLEKYNALTILSCVPISKHVSSPLKLPIILILLDIVLTVNFFQSLDEWIIYILYYHLYFLNFKWEYEF